MNEINILIPDYINSILTYLEAAGFEAFVVGGCVRDSLRGTVPHDWDICTSAQPSETTAVLSEIMTVIPTGIKHGTVTVVSNGKTVEVTTFRSESAYTDNRRPSSVKFLNTIDGDLSRRDFTVNAMAYNNKHGLIDMFGGLDDLNKGILRCVGNPSLRFTEDGLRIMRALRFSASCRLNIEPNTASAIHDCRKLLLNISSERIFSELKGLLLSENPSALLLEYRDVFEVILPEAFASDSFCAEFIRMTDILPQNFSLRLAALLFNTGKENTSAVMSRLKTDNETRRCVYSIIDGCTAPPPASEIAAKHMLCKLGVSSVYNILNFGLAHASICGGGTAAYSNAIKTVDNIIKNGECFSLSDLDITGRDLIESGIPAGPEIGRILNRLLCDVIDGKTENRKASLAARIFL